MSQPNQCSVCDGPIYQIKLAICRHTKKAIAAAGFGPYGSNGPLGSLAFIEVTAFVFDNQNAPVVQHGYEIGIKFLVGKLKPERSPFALHVPNPIPNRIHAVDVNGAIKLLPAWLQISHQRSVVLVELRIARIGLIERIGRFVKDHRQIGIDGKILCVGSEQGIVVFRFPFAPQILDQGNERPAKVIFVAGKNVQIMSGLLQGS